ncbi:hypothetical protein [Azospirillum sp.]|uniref:hypothetical protein n=1 Tax=Azospirillum sp. TaxID=34012 RepID=UPI003D74C08D
MSGTITLPPTGLLHVGVGVADFAPPFRPSAPAVITGRFGRPPARQDNERIRVDITRQPLRTALDWQAETVRIWREHPECGPGFKGAMERAGLHKRSLVLFSMDGGPLRFAYIGEPQRRFFGNTHADSMIGKPQVDAGYDGWAQALEAQYLEAMQGGEPVHNHVAMHGLQSTPVVYTHTLIGWECGGRRVVVAMVAY